MKILPSITYSNSDVLEGLSTRLRKGDLRKDRENNESTDTLGKKQSHPLVSKASYSMVWIVLIDTYKLSRKGREKSTIFVEDLTMVVETAISTTKKKFGYSRYRIELCLFLILIEFKFEYTKGFLGSKDKNIYILLEIIFDPSLVLSPYIFLLGLLFADCAFKRVNSEEVLISVGQLPRLYIRDRYNELPLLLDLALDDILVFRLRYRARKALDNSGAISDSLRNLIIYHADSRTFLKYYLDRWINKNLPTIIRGLNLDNDIIYIACRISRTINPNRP
ncbi:uncharacterized protein N7500_008537 [Penicillium coprophilum]|uniref:uncharacterized protein n=1 Tax=Penicillium coprophilum TaxID=36646 RepID=UPI00238ACED9|nr:uncharacterized protein N7500_008537 [Penicillium coprophilum]KAJ5158886.1 hypothetical protein N7500_008537 [Penicillium coprophilum]